MVRMQENINYENFRYKGMRSAREVGRIFKDVVASGEDMFAPSASQPPIQQYDNDDVYQPAMNIEEDLEEGLGDSEDKMFGARMNLRTSNEYILPSAPSDSKSQGKRKRADGRGQNKRKKAPASYKIAYNDYIVPSAPRDCESQVVRKRGDGRGQNKRKKTPASHKIADALSQIAANSEALTKLLKVLTEKEIRRSQIASAAELAKELFKMEEINCDKDLLFRCCNLLVFDAFREIFTALKKNRKALVAWLRSNAYKEHPFGKGL